MKTEKEVCELLRNEKKENGLNSKYYIKILHRIEDAVDKENIGKLNSEVYPTHVDNIANISNRVDELICDRESKEYKKYFNEDYHPFIVEVWERTDNTIKLIYKRNNEYEDFIEVNSK